MEARYYQKEAVEAAMKSSLKKSLLVLPTGTGKSVIIALLIKEILRVSPRSRVLVLTHSAILVKQNAEKFKEMCKYPHGVYSASLKKEDVFQPIIFGGIQSVAPAIERGVKFGTRDYVIIDEAHAVGKDELAMYSKVLGVYGAARVIGLTATPYRLDGGLLVDSGIFDGVDYDISDAAGMARLCEEGFLCRVENFSSSLKLNLDSVSISSDFSDEQATEEMIKIYKSALDSVIDFNVAKGLKKCMIFTPSISASEIVHDYLKSKHRADVYSVVVHSKLSNEVNARSLEEFKHFSANYIVSSSMLTTGFDCPAVDLIIDLAPTISASRHVQKIGRGTRVCAGKELCYYIDFAGNLDRIGPIDDVEVISVKKGVEKVEEKAERDVKKRRVFKEFCVSSGEVMSSIKVVGVKEYVYPTSGVDDDFRGLFLSMVKAYDRVQVREGFVDGWKKVAIEQAFSGVDVGNFIIECVGDELFDFCVSYGLEGVGVGDVVVSFWGRAGKSVYSLEIKASLCDAVKFSDELFDHVGDLMPVVSKIVKVDELKIDASKLRYTAGFDRCARSANFPAIVMYSPSSRAVVSSYK